MRASLELWPVALALLVALATGAAPKDELVVVVHSSSAVRRLDAVELEAIFSSAQRTWPDGSAVIPFSYPPEDPLRQQFDQAVLRMTPDQVGRFWVDQRIRADRRPPRQVPDALLAVRLVAKLPGSIAFVPASLVSNDVRIVARIRKDAVVEP
jgi:hypothetical protein